MSSVPVMISGVLWDHALKAGRAVTLMGEATIPGLGVGGGPIYPPEQPPGGGSPPGIWGPPGPWPTPPINFPPGWVGGVPPGGGGGQPPGIWPNPPEGQAPIPSHPIALPGDPWWPGNAPKPPEMPPPGSPPVVLPGAQPIHPMTPPPAIVVDYPGVGKVLVPLPVAD